MYQLVDIVAILQSMMSQAYIITKVLGWKDFYVYDTVVKIYVVLVSTLLLLLFRNVCLSIQMHAPTHKRCVPIYCITEFETVFPSLIFGDFWFIPPIAPIKISAKYKCLQF